MADEAKTDQGETLKKTRDKLNTEAEAAYESMANEARINRALLELAEKQSDAAAGIGRKAALVTMRQRNESNLRNIIGKARKLQDDYRKNVDTALEKLRIQGEADESSYAARKAAEENMAQLSQRRFDVDLGLQQQQADANKSDSDFNKAYKLYLKRYIGKDKFKDMTGISVKNLPRPRKIKNIFSDPSLISNPGSAGDGTQYKLDYLKSNKAEYVKKYGEGQYNAAVNYYSMKSTDSALGSTSSAMKKLDALVNACGTNSELRIDKFYKEFSLYAAPAYNEVNGAFAVYEAVKYDYPLEALKTYSPETAEQFTYTDSFEDVIRQALGVVPAAFDPVGIAKGVKGYILPATWDYESISQLLDTVSKRRNISESRKSGEGPEQWINAVAEALGADLSDPFYLMGGAEHVAQRLESLLQDPASAGEDGMEFIASVTKCLNGQSDYVWDNLDVQRARQLDHIIDLVSSDGAAAAYDGAYRARGLEIAGEYKKDILSDEAAKLGAIDYYIDDMAGNSQKKREAEAYAMGTYGSAEIQLGNGFLMDTTTGFISDRPDHVDDLGYYTNLPSSEKINDIISKQMMLVSLGLGYDEDEIDKLRSYGFNEAADFIISKKQGDYFVATDNVKSDFESELVSQADTEAYNAKLKEAKVSLEKGAAESSDFGEGIEKAKNSGVHEAIFPAFVRDSPEEIIYYINAMDWENLQTWSNRTADATREQINAFLMAFGRNTHSPGVPVEYGYTTEQERNTLLYYYGIGDLESFKEYQKVIEPELRQRGYDDQHKWIEDAVEEPGPRGEILSGMMSVGEAIAAPAAWIETVYDAITGQRVDPTSYVQQAVSDIGYHKELAVSHIDDPFLKGLTSTIIDLAPSLPFYLIPGGQIAGPLFTGLSSAGTDAAQQNRTGASPWESALHSTVTGAIDFFSSKLMLHGFGKIMAGPGASLSKTFTETLYNYAEKAFKSLVVGGTVAAENILAKNISDMVIAGGRSRFAQAADHYESEGMSKDEAMAAAAYDSFIKQPIAAAIKNGGKSAVFSVFNSAAGDIKAALGNTSGGVSGLPATRDTSYSADTVADAVKTVQTLPEGAVAGAEYNGVMNSYYRYGLDPSPANAALTVSLAEQLLKSAGGSTGQAAGEESGGNTDIDSKQALTDNNEYANDTNGGIRAMGELLKGTKCSAGELYRYLKKINGEAADGFINSGEWPADVQIPKGPDALNEDGLINWSKAPQGGYELDDSGKAIKQQLIPAIGEVIDRFGPPEGRYVCPVVDGKPYAYDQRSLPYVEDAAQYHQYEVIGDFSRTKQYIEECTDVVLKVEIEDYIGFFYNNDYSKVILYSGKTARVEGFGSGGAIQYEMPLPISWLVKLGMLKQIK